jgi:hypothetical protein
MTKLSASNAHLDLVRRATSGSLTEEDALVWMVLLHTHQIRIKAEFVDDSWRRHERNGVVSLSPHTQRGVAAVIAELWTEIKHKRKRSVDDPRNSYCTWYYEFNFRVPYETIEAIPASLLERLEQLRSLLVQDARVIAVIPDD